MLARTCALSLLALLACVRAEPARAQAAAQPAPGSTVLPAAASAADAPAAAVRPQASSARDSQLAAIESEADARAEKKPGEGCLLGELCLGPVLTLGVLDVFGIGAQARTDHWGVVFDYQFVRFSAQGIPISLSLLSVEGRLYPFGGAFFLAGGLSWQHASLSGQVHYGGSSVVPPTDAEVAGKLNIPVLKLGVGFFGRSGFVLGIDLAFGIQLGGNTVELSTNLPRVKEVVETEEKVRDRADKWVRALPFLLQLNLIRVGFLF